MANYSISITTSSDTDALLPVFVAKYNAKHGTSYTTLQYATKICNDAIDRQTQNIIEMMGQ